MKLRIVTYTDADSINMEEVECEGHWFSSGTVTLYFSGGRTETREHVVAVGNSVQAAD